MNYAPAILYHIIVTLYSFSHVDSVIQIKWFSFVRHVFNIFVTNALMCKDIFIIFLHYFPFSVAWWCAAELTLQLYYIITLEDHQSRGQARTFFTNTSANKSSGEKKNIAGVLSVQEILLLLNSYFVLEISA